MCHIDLQNIRYVESEGFYNCSSLGWIGNTEKLIDIGEQAFCKCESLREINLSAVENIGNYCFANCVQLQSKIQLNNVKEIGKSSFKGCELISEVCITSHLKELPLSCFHH